MKNGSPRAPLTHELIARQIQVMKQQLALYARAPAARPQRAIAPAASPALKAPAAPSAQSAAAVTSEAPAPAPAVEAPQPAAPPPVIARVPAVESLAPIELSPQQRQRLDVIVRRYAARTRGSKSAHDASGTGAHERVISPAARALMPDVAYPLVIERAVAARVWDVDGNEYVDASNGLGGSYFGWQNDAIAEAAVLALSQGCASGTRHPLVADVAKLFCALSGAEHASVCGSQADALSTARQLARAHTGRFPVLSISDDPRAGFVDDQALIYGDAQTLTRARELAPELAAILVEPIPRRRPADADRAFLRELRDIADRAGVVLIFNELTTGMRLGAGGAAALFDVQPDLSVYGGVVAAGFPLGIVAGRRAVLSELPRIARADDGVHPLSLASAKVVLERMTQEGAALADSLAEQTRGLCSTLNARFTAVQAPLRADCFGSMWIVRASAPTAFLELLFLLVRDRGVFAHADEPCFLGTEHRTDELARLVSAFDESVREMQAGGFMAGTPVKEPTKIDPKRPPVPGARLGRDPSGTPAWYVPSTNDPKKYVKYEGS